MNDELPESWEIVKLQDIASWGSGGTPPRKNPKFYGGDIPWIKTGELGDGLILDTEEKITSDGLKNSSAKVFPKGSVAIAMYGATIGKVSILGIDAATNQACAVGIPDLRLTGPQYIFQYLRSQKEAFIAAGKGGAQPNLSQGIIKEWLFPLAPLAEQKRIADKLEAVLGRVDACRARLDRVPALLKRFRQSVLAAATSGKLTEEWRITNGVNDEWDYVPLGEVVNNHDGKRIPISEAKRQSRRGNIPYYGAAGVIDSIDGFTHDGKFLMIGEDGANLVTRSKPNAFIATGKIWVNNHAHVLSCKSGAPEEFLAHFINSIPLDPYVSGSAQPKLNQKNLNSIIVPQPPLPEQQEIVRRVEELFALADRIEARLAVVRKTADRLTPSVLAKAFRGELVPQDPNDEPASVLLERLQSQAAPQPVRAPRKKRASKAPVLAD